MVSVFTRVVIIEFSLIKYSLLLGNNTWSVRTNRISRPPLMGWNPARKQKKKKVFVVVGLYVFILHLFEYETC